MSDEFDFLDEDFGLDEEVDRSLPTNRELLTLKLLREAIQAQNPDDAVMQDFAEYVLPNLLRVAIGVTAKGGKFFDELDRVDRQRADEDKKKVRRDNAADQSLNTHILNGLFPANFIERRLSQIDDGNFIRYVGEKERRLVLAAFILHDFEKFPDVPNDCRKLSIADHRLIITAKIQQLGLDRLIDPQQPTAYLDYIDDLLCMAYNAQRRWDTNWNFSVHGLNPTLDDRKLVILSELTCLADSLSSIVKHPYDAHHKRFKELLHTLSNGQLSLTYHSIAENRGVLTNVVNNALMEAHTSCNDGDNIYYEPLLYLPTGTIYLTKRNAPEIDRSGLSDRVVASIKKLCAGQLQQRQTGFGRDGKGMKYADYYNLFFDDIGLMRVALDATLRILRTGKSSVAGSRSDNLVKFQQQQVLPADYDFKFTDDIRIDQIAEFGDVASRKIWGDREHKIAEERKKNKKLPTLPELDLIQKVAEFWNLSEYSPQIREIKRINESLKEQKLKGNTGGVPYEWYYLAAKYLEKHPGIEDVRETCEHVIDYIATLVQPIVQGYPMDDGWDDLREWCDRVVMLPGDAMAKSDSADIFLKELANYNNAKKSGRGKQLICSISHSAYTVTEQMESAVLFTPQVYTNKQMLGGSNAKRNISSIAGMEMMLRQILMNQTQAVGKRFEDGKYRYLYFYPTYYFTPETNKFLQKAYSGIVQTRFDTGVRNHFINRDLEASFERDRYQSVDAFLIDDDLERKVLLDEKDPEFRRDRTFKLSYPEDLPLTFHFMALPPEKPSGKDPEKKVTDTASWIMPAWLALAFPMILDVKTVASESPIPPFNDGSEFEETVFFDGIPQAIKTLLGNTRFRLDHILEGWIAEDGVSRASPLNSLTAAYAIHLDANAKQGVTYDPNWGKLVELAEDIETNPLSIFSYLAKSTRGQKYDVPSIQKIKLYLLSFYPCFDPHTTYDFENEEWKMSSQSPLNHPRELTLRFRRFYRHAKKQGRQPIASNAILKPVKLAADTLFKDRGSSTLDGLIDNVTSELAQLMKRVHSSGAEGRAVIFGDPERELVVIRDFAEYFIKEVFARSFAEDKASLQGRQMNYILNTCEYIYRLEHYQERRLKAQEFAGDLIDDDDELENNKPNLEEVS